MRPNEDLRIVVYLSGPFDYAQMRQRLSIKIDTVSLCNPCNPGNRHPAEGRSLTFAVTTSHTCVQWDSPPLGHQASQRLPVPRYPQHRGERTRETAWVVSITSLHHARRSTISHKHVNDGLINRYVPYATYSIV